MVFEMCTCDYPQENTKVLVSIGNMSLNIKVFLDEVNPFSRRFSLQFFIDMMSISHYIYRYTISNKSLYLYINYLFIICIDYQGKVKAGSFKLTRMKCWKTVTKVSFQEHIDCDYPFNILIQLLVIVGQMIWLLKKLFSSVFPSATRTVTNISSCYHSNI